MLQIANRAKDELTPAIHYQNPIPVFFLLDQFSGPDPGNNQVIDSRAPCLPIPIILITFTHTLWNPGKLAREIMNALVRTIGKQDCSRHLMSTLSTTLLELELYQALLCYVLWAAQLEEIVGAKGH